MYIVGTAGHVDHGKSTLIEAITGTHPDRLQEERDREMSIVLGFDHFQLPDGKEISVVDVPGHRDFIENMLSGIGSIDACLLVIAADEGVMPQTREHLNILHLLEVEKGVIALTKADLVDDPEWLGLVELEIQELLKDTALKDAPFVRVSAKEKTGLDELLNKLSEVLADQPPHLDLGRPRLSVDRVFLMSGFGSIVTGTLLDGSLQVGDEITLLPGDKSGRIRGLQNHSQEVKEIGPGNRVAVNISGIEYKDIQRGDVVTHKGDYQSTRRLDVRFQYLNNLEQPITHNMEAKLFLGADETTARIRLLGMETLKPGESAWLQLEVEDPVVAVRGDRYILRRPSPSETLGGGVVVDPHPASRHKRFDVDMLDRLDTLSGGDTRDLLIQEISRAGVLVWSDLMDMVGLDEETVRETLDELVGEGLVLVLGKPGSKKEVITTSANWNKLKTDLAKKIEEYHQTWPLRAGMPLEELKNQSGVKENAFRQLVETQVNENNLVQVGPVISLADFSIQFSPEQKSLIKELLGLFSKNPAQPPSVADSRALVGEEVFNALLITDELVQLSPDVVFKNDSYQKMTQDLEKLITAGGPITVAQARDNFGSSRKYMLAFLEKLDAEGITVREGDVRRLK